MIGIRRHYRAVEKEIELHTPWNLSHLHRPIVIVPLSGWSKIAEKALCFAMTLSTEIHALQVKFAEDEAGDLRDQWTRLVESPALELGVNPPKLTVIESPYRHLFGPILKFIDQIEQEHPDRYIAILIPEMVERHWRHYFLHNQHATVLKALLLVKGNQRISVVNVPWYLTV
jgi:hypothetical protein